MQQVFTERSFGIRNFSKSCKSFKMFRITSTIANSIYTDFLTVLIVVGIWAASVSTYVTVTLYNKIKIVVYMAFPSLTFCAYMISILMTQYSDGPRKNAILFCIFWRRQLNDKIGIKLLKRCLTKIGYTVGPYGLITAKLGILFCDDI